MEDGRLVGQDCGHVNSEGLHILADEDSMLLGLISIGLEMSSEVKHRVLEDNRRTDRILLLGRHAVVVVDGRKSEAVVDGRKSVGVVDGRRARQRHPGGRPGGQNGPDTLVANPHLRVHCPSHTSLQGMVHSACRALP